MLAAQNVEGAGLSSLLSDVRATFLSACAVQDHEDYVVPNSLRLVALDVFDDRSPADRARIIGDLLDGNAELSFRLTGRRVFAHARTTGDYLTDFVCEIVRQILRQDPTILIEDELRQALAGSRE